MGRLAAGFSRRSLVALPMLAALIAAGCPAGAAQASTGRVTRSAAGQAAAPAVATNGPYAQLTSVSCPRARWCVAVGFHTVGSGPALYPLAEAWNGRA